MRKLWLVALAVIGSVLMSRAQTPAPPKDYTAHVVGYAHMDMAWLWRWEESIHDIMYNTFRNQLELMDRFPDYTYAQDQAVVFDMVERYYPDIFKGMVQRVKTGNFIPLSSTWVQMDENLVDGESLARQFLYGQKYSKDKFGRYIRVAWQPDVFGHPVTMPQITRLAGPAIPRARRSYGGRGWTEPACWGTRRRAGTRSRWTTSTSRYWV